MRAGNRPLDRSVRPLPAHGQVVSAAVILHQGADVVELSRLEQDRRRLLGAADGPIAGGRPAGEIGDPRQVRHRGRFRAQPELGAVVACNPERVVTGLRGNDIPMHPLAVGIRAIDRRLEKIGHPVRRVRRAGLILGAVRQVIDRAAGDPRVDLAQNSPSVRAKRQAQQKKQKPPHQSRNQTLTPNSPKTRRALDKIPGNGVRVYGTETRKWTGAANKKSLPAQSREAFFHSIRRTMARRRCRRSR